MKGHVCDLCGEPAVVHDTALSSGSATARHLCRVHGRGVWIEAAGHCDPRLPAALSVLDDLRCMADETRGFEGR